MFMTTGCITDVSGELEGVNLALKSFTVGCYIVIPWKNPEASHPDIVSWISWVKDPGSAGQEGRVIPSFIEILNIVPAYAVKEHNIDLSCHV